MLSTDTSKSNLTFGTLSDPGEIDFEIWWNSLSFEQLTLTVGGKSRKLIFCKLSLEGSKARRVNLLPTVE